VDAPLRALRDSFVLSREGFHIVIDFRTGTIVFLFGGPDSGQQ
jgi:hypothetical protein